MNDLLETILVCVSSPQHAETLIQRGKLLADAFKGKCYVLSVLPGQEKDLEFNQIQTKMLFESLAEKYGLPAIQKYKNGQKVSDLIAETVREKSATQIVMAHAVQSKWEMVVKHSLVNHLFELLEGVDLHLVEVNRDVYDPAGEWDKGIEASLVKEEGGYKISFDDNGKEGTLGTFFRELSTDFSNGFFVKGDGQNQKVIKIHNGTAAAEAVEKD
ncbi:histidine kinase [Bacillus infantis]|uniref:histidine kinase n=1 Tax=Bacillus TaxID=1386 RepID=UPI00006B2508|nr:osmosensitive K+ channel histidine kinase [Bacillus sp. NRRL B-14911]